MVMRGLPRGMLKQHAGHVILRMTSGKEWGIEIELDDPAGLDGSYQIILDMVKNAKGFEMIEVMENTTVRAINVESVTKAEP